MSLDFEVMVFQKNRDAQQEYEANIRHFIARKLETSEGQLQLQRKEEDYLFYGNLPSSIFHLIGTVHLDLQRFANARGISERLLNLIRDYCIEKDFDNSLIRFSPTIYDDFDLLKTKFDSRNRQNIHSIAFGTIVNLKHFKPHIRIGEKGSKFMSKGDLDCKQIEARFDHHKTRVFLDLYEQNSTRKRFIVEYWQINYIVISKIANFWAIYFVLTEPPLTYEVNQVSSRNAPSSFASDAAEDPDEKQEVEPRGNKVRYSCNEKLLRIRTVSASVDPAVFTKSNVIQVNLKSKLYSNQFNYFKRIWTIVSNINRYGNCSVYVGRIEDSGVSLGDICLPQPRSLPYSVHYALQCFDNISFQLHDELQFANAKNLFIEKVEMLSLDNEIATKEALEDLFRIKCENIAVNNFYALEKRFEERKMFPSIGKYEHLVEIRRCFLTPSRVILLPPLLYQRSRILREANPDSFLRVCVRDDNTKELNFTLPFVDDQNACRKFLKEIIVDRLKNGLILVGRKFEYLGSSCSQLRDIGMMLFAEDMGRNAKAIRDSIGDLSKITSPSKYMARQGQAFSQSIAFLPHIDSNCVKDDDEDITSNDDQRRYIFSDGVGRIRWDLAEKLTELVDKARSNKDIAYIKRLKPYSAFQIRYKGCKGMVTLDPNLKTTDKQMIIRKSMNKFPSESSAIDVIKVSEPRYVHLGRPFVMLLDQLLVDHSVFLTMVREELQKIVDSFNCKCKALEVIENFSRLKLNYSKLLDCDIDILGEMFFRNSLGVVVKKSVKDIKLRSQVKLPAHFGRSMLGVLDETKTLKEGQVFVRYSMFNDYMECKVVEGEVLITKFPCMHPGDVRKFEAVDVPDLHHIVDCIVFPQQGSRPHPDQMAGSDLDGDEYAVIWEKSFLFPGPNKEAMEYPSYPETTRQNQVTVDDMLTFITEFIEKDSVGRLCSAHLALSDHKSIYDDDCMELAKQHPRALDFAKSGDFSNEKIKYSVFYPDYMEKSDHKATYMSERVLGKLYRLCCLFEESHEFESILGEQLSGNEQLLTYPDWKIFENEAKEAYFEYRRKIAHILTQYGIEDEFSLLTGCFMQTQKFICGRNENDASVEMINMLVTNVVKDLRFRFRSVIQDINEEDKKLKTKSLASAWYLVTRKLNENNREPFYGLPWILSEVLAEIAMINSNKELPGHTCVLYREVRTRDLTSTSESVSVEMELLLKRWLQNRLNSFLGFAKIANTVESKYTSLIRPIVNQHRNVESVDVGLQRVLRHISSHIRSGDEFENMLALSASMTLRRFQQTGNLDCFTQPLNENSSKMEILRICLRRHNHSLGYYLENDKEKFFQTFKDYGIDYVYCDVYGSSLILSAFGTRKDLRKIRHVLTTYSILDSYWKTAEKKLEKIHRRSIWDDEDEEYYDYDSDF